MAARTPSQEPLLDSRHCKRGQIADAAERDDAGEQGRRAECPRRQQHPMAEASRPARISQTTDRISATVRLSGMPERMSGLAEGSAILKITAGRDMCSDCATS